MKDKFIEIQIDDDKYSINVSTIKYVVTIGEGFGMFLFIDGSSLSTEIKYEDLMKKINS